MFFQTKVLGVWLVALLWYEVEVHGAVTTSHQITSTQVDSPHTTKTIPFNSAVEIEANLAFQEQQLAESPAIPIPTNLDVYPQYKIIDRLVPVLPPRQIGLGTTDSQAAMARAMSPNPGKQSTLKNQPQHESLDTRADTLRVMIAGDSMTHGLEGDFTWRYRLWQWFKQNSIQVQFVGPYKGTQQPPEVKQPQPPLLYGSPPEVVPYRTSGGYAQAIDSGFLANSNHFAIWGRAAAVSKGLIEDVLQQSPSDILLVMLGFNDMGWFYSDAFGTLDSMATLVNNARKANPNIKIAIATVPHRRYLGGRDDLVQNTNIYNDRLPGEIAKWTTPQSPVYLVDLANSYDCRPGGCPAGYDGLHPNAWGEFEIASAFSRTLVNDMKLGSKPLAVPPQSDASLARPLPAPSNLKVFSSPQGVTATWDPVYGAHSYDITVTINGGPNAFSATSSENNRWDSQWSIEGWTYAVSVRASAGETIKGPYTETLSAVARPQLAPPPDNVRVASGDSGMTVTWDPPHGPYSDSIVEYNVIFWDWAPDRCSFLNGAAFKSSPAVIKDLRPFTNYLVAVVTWNKNGQGFPAIVNNVVTNLGRPPVPDNLKVDSQDATTIRLTWTGSNSAGGYHVWYRNIHKEGDKLRIVSNITDGSCGELSYLFPGVWNYAFALSSFNGNDESVTGPEVVAPSSTVEGGTGTGPKCPAKEPWCPQGASISVPAGSPTPTSPGGGAPPDSKFPTVPAGFCVGPDCHDGQCTDILCAGLGCWGPDCYRGYCTGNNCIAVGCIGPHCNNGICIGEGCVNKGCIGPDCDDDHQHCRGLHCIGIGCIGKDCGPKGTCFGPNCSISVCRGLNCVNGKCVGPGCHPEGGHLGGDPSAPPPEEEPEECTTTTFNVCTTSCAYSTTTSDCNTKCSDIPACRRPSDKSTSTSISQTCRPPPAMTKPSAPRGPDGKFATLGQGGEFGYLDTYGANTTSDSSFPTLTKTSSQETCTGRIKTSRNCDNGSCNERTYCSSYPFPTLTGTIHPTDCPETTTVFTRCNGSGNHSACLPITQCSPYPVTPHPTSTALSCDDSRDECVGTTTINTCKKSARTPMPLPRVYSPHGDVPSSSASSAAATSTARSAESVDKTEFDLSEIIDEWNQPRLDSLLRRDNCKSPHCICKGTYTTCLSILIEEYHELKAVFKGKVWEDGKRVCDFKDFECRSCKGGSWDCGDGNNIRWDHNEIWYHSSKQNYTFHEVLTPINSEKYECLWWGTCSGNVYSSEKTCKGANDADRD